MYPKFDPRQPWRPPPKPMKEKGLALSSSRGGANRSGSYTLGFLKTCGSRCEYEGDVATTWPCKRKGRAKKSASRKRERMTVQACE